MFLMLMLNGLSAAAVPASPSDPHRHEPDHILVARAQADPRAFGPLYERYHDRIYRYGYMRLGNREAAEDVTAEVFVKALSNLSRYRVEAAFLAWLYTIARHTVADHYQKRRPTHPWEDDVIDRVARSGEDASAGSLDRAALAQALGTLPEEQRAVLELQLAGWSGEEIAAALHKTEAAVKMMRYRAVRRLQELLAPNAAPQGAPQGGRRG